MKPNALAYLGVRTKSLEDWLGYGTGLLGMQPVDQTSKMVAMRMDDHKQRLMIDEDGGEGISYFGWEVADATALEGLAARIEASGTKVNRPSPDVIAKRRVMDMIYLTDPAGHRLEFCHGPEKTDEAFVPSRNISGFRTGPLGLGHVVTFVETAENLLPFYRDVLGFGLSDYYHEPFEAYFFHVNPRHHSLAFIANGTNKPHHLMVELFSLDDVGQAYDIAEAEQGRIATSLGRHCGDYMTSFYSWNPSAFMVEYGWGGRLIDPDTWEPALREEGPSIWGHNRVWQEPEAQKKARELRMQNARDGLRQPVQVIEGNFNLMPGTCPWWDNNIRKS